MKRRSWAKRLRTHGERVAGVWPLGIVAFYGPTDRHASKVTVGIQIADGSEIEPFARWYQQDDLDVRVDSRIGNEVEKFLRDHAAKSVYATRGIIGCPHEEGIDYPDGQECPSCPFWHGRDRWDNA